MGFDRQTVNNGVLLATVTAATYYSTVLARKKMSGETIEQKDVDNALMYGTAAFGALAPYAVSGVKQVGSFVLGKCQRHSNLDEQLVQEAPQPGTLVSKKPTTQQHLLAGSTRFLGATGIGFMANASARLAGASDPVANTIGAGTALIAEKVSEKTLLTPTPKPTLNI